MELNAEQIKKALECCVSDVACCSKCPYVKSPKCLGLVRKNSLSLIKELTEENEGLNTQVEMWKSTAYCEKDRVDSIKIDTVRKMQSEIEKRCIKGGIYPAFVANVIAAVAKELLEGKNAQD